MGTSTLHSLSASVGNSFCGDHRSTCPCVAETQCHKATKLTGVCPSREGLLGTAEHASGLPSLMPFTCTCSRSFLSPEMKRSHLISRSDSDLYQTHSAAAFP